MTLHIVVTAKQVIDPEMPQSAFQVDSEQKAVVTPTNIPPVVNGFDENAVEAALRIKDKTSDTIVTVVAMGHNFSLDVMKKPLSMGADQLILLQDASFQNTIDSFTIAMILATGIKKLDPFDLIICGRQASDWDNAQVPLFLAEALDLPCITIGKDVAIGNDKVTVQRLIPDGYEMVEASLPALVTVSNELGQPRYPTLRGIMGASRKTPTVWDATDLDMGSTISAPLLSLKDLFIPSRDQQCELIDGETDEDKGRQLALKLREAKLI